MKLYTYETGGILVLYKAANGLVNKLVKKGIIEAGECELYCFGIETSILKGLHLLSYVILGLLLGKIPELIVFLIVFIPLREYSGGYHAASKLGCYIVSCMVVFSMLLTVKFMPAAYYSFSIYLAMFSGAILLFLVPVEAKTKPLDDSEKIYYKSKAGFTIILLLTLSLLFFMVNQRLFSFILALSLFYELIAAVIGKLSLIIGKHGEGY